MATSRLSTRFTSLLLMERRISPLRCKLHQCRRKASSYTGMEELSEDVDSISSLSFPGPTEQMIESFDPVLRSKNRKRQLPSSRCSLLPPKPSPFSSSPGPPHSPNHTLLTDLAATNSALQNTIVVPCTPTNRRHPPIPPRASSYLAHSPSPASSKHTPAPWRRTSSPCSTSTILRVRFPVLPRSASAVGRAHRRTSKTGHYALPAARPV